MRRIAALRQVIDNDEFSLEYQTQHAAETTLQGAEALLRWDHGAEGRISPAEFIPLEVVAEGVETDAQRRWLHDQGCRRFQGFLFARPAPANTVAPQPVE